MKAAFFLMIFCFSVPVFAVDSECGNSDTWGGDRPLEKEHHALMEMKNSLQKPGQHIIDCYLENSEFFARVVAFMVAAKTEANILRDGVEADKYRHESDYWAAGLRDEADLERLRNEPKTRHAVEEFVQSGLWFPRPQSPP